MRTRTYSGGQACNEMHPNWPDCRLGSPDRPPSDYQRGGLSGTGAITGHGGIGPTGTGNVTGGGTRRMTSRRGLARPGIGVTGNYTYEVGCKYAPDRIDPANPN